MATVEERIEKLKQRQAQLKAQEKKLLAQKSKAERNARTKRLIEVGAIVEKAIGIELDTPEKKEKLQKILLQERQARNGNTYSYAAFFRTQLEADQDKE